jgi:hypothetical protein
MTNIDLRTAALSALGLASALVLMQKADGATWLGALRSGIAFGLLGGVIVAVVPRPDDVPRVGPVDVWFIVLAVYLLGLLLAYPLLKRRRERGVSGDRRLP